MFKLTSRQLRELCAFARLADKGARSDLVGGYIRDEDDYTSNFTGALRRLVNSNSRTGITATSFLWGTSHERQMGCDGAIIIHSDGHAKIATFEAKLPRVSDPNHAWDYAQTSTGLSHFSDQLNRQQRFSDVHAIFEMFYCELPFSRQPAFMQPEGSTCVWHSTAFNFDKTRANASRPWCQTELQDLLQKQSLCIARVLEDVCTCSAGRPIKVPKDPSAVAGEFSLRGHLLFLHVSPTLARRTFAM